jgi:hypothetical protein
VELEAHARYSVIRRIAASLALLLLPACASAQEQTSGSDGLAKQLQNPVAHLISVPIESNWEFAEGPTHATDYYGALKPVIPFSLGANWNLITRTILPFSYSVLLDKGSNSRVGVGDAIATAYFSPSKPVRGWFWGVGPGLIVPSATDDSLGSGKWSAGPTGAVIRQSGPWSVFTLVGHASSVAGNPGRDRVNTTFLQPSLSYSTAKDTTFGIDTASSYDWTAGLWSVPLEVSASQVLVAGRQSMSLGLLLRSHLDRPPLGPTWGLTFTATFVFPKAS